MPRRNSRDPRTSAKARLGELLAKARESAGFPSQAALAEHLQTDRTVIGKAESGERPPSDRVLEAWVQACHVENVELVITLAELARAGDDNNEPIPSWFADYAEDIESVAHTIRTWQPVIIHGLLQTPRYARALFESMGLDAETVDARTEARIKRQAILDRAEPCALWAVLDYAVLQRNVGSPETMHEQLLYLAERARLPNVGVQIVPAENGANAGCVGAITVASVAGKPDIVVTGGVHDDVSETQELVRDALGIFDRVRGDALPRGASLDVIMEAAKRYDSSDRLA
jgi:transcriptional regulator with XRE-family HTH domain